MSVCDNKILKHTNTESTQNKHTYIHTSILHELHIYIVCGYEIFFMCVCVCEYTIIHIANTNTIGMHI